MELRLENITKKYRTITALDDFSYTFNEGICGVLGPNGAGKSTLMNIITDGIKPDGGHVFFEGDDIIKMGRRYRFHVGYMPQQQSVFSGMTVKHFMFYMASLKGMRGLDAGKSIADLLERLNLTGRADTPMGQLSGGMKQRSLIAQALLGEPDILVLDEPTAGLDPKERVHVRTIIKELSNTKIVIISTHIVADIENIADDIIFMNHGKIILKKDTGHDNMEDLESTYMRLFEDEEQ